MRDGMRHYVSPDELDVLRRIERDGDDLCDSDYWVFRSLVKRMDEEAQEQSSEEMRGARVRAQYSVDSDDDTNVDDDAEVMKVEAGYWVQSWLWIPKDV